MEGGAHGETRACELDPQIFVGRGNIRFTPTEEVKFLKIFLGGIENHDISFVKVDNHLVKIEKVGKSIHAPLKALSEEWQDDHIVYKQEYGNQDVM